MTIHKRRLYNSVYEWFFIFLLFKKRVNNPDLRIIYKIIDLTWIK